MVEFITGPQGPQGVQGNPGPQGPQGNPGPLGQRGPAGYQGPAGVHGAPGARMHPAQATAPDPALGVTGDWAFGNDGRVYRKLDSTTWIEHLAVSPLVGPPGQDGADGQDGAIGPQGAQGIPGPVGPKGLTGPTGPVGPKGATGPAGAKGATGPTNMPAFVTFLGAFGGLTGNSAQIRSAFNVNSVLKLGDGIYRIGFTNTLPSRNYGIIGTSMQLGDSPYLPATVSVRRGVAWNDFIQTNWVDVVVTDPANTRHDSHCVTVSILLAG